MKRSTYVAPASRGHLDIQVTPLGCLGILVLVPISVGIIVGIILIILAVVR